MASPYEVERAFGLGNQIGGRANGMVSRVRGAARNNKAPNNALELAVSSLSLPARSSTRCCAGLCGRRGCRRR